MELFILFFKVAFKLFDLNPTVDQVHEWWQQVTDGNESGKDTLLLKMEEYVQICMLFFPNP